jgi:hypothetical protein
MQYKKAHLISQKRAEALNPERGRTFTRMVLDQYELDYVNGFSTIPRPNASQVWNWDEKGQAPKGKFPPVFSTGIISDLPIQQLRTGEQNPFWVSIFYGENASGHNTMPPILIHQGGDKESTYIPGHFIAGLPENWLVYCTPSGYQNQDGMRPWAVYFVKHTKAAKDNCQYVFTDGFYAHFDVETLQFLLDNYVRVIFSRANASTIDQSMDMGPNKLLDTKYNDAMINWRNEYPGISFNQSFFNGVIKEAWSEYINSPNRIAVVQKAFKDANIYPMIEEITDIYTGKEIACAKLCSSFITDTKDAATATKIRNSLPDEENDGSTTVSFTSIPSTMVKVNTVSSSGDLKENKFTLRTAALDILDRNLVQPAQKLRKIYEEQKKTNLARYQIIMHQQLKLAEKILILQRESV